MNPGDTLEGRGTLLQHGRFIAEVDYYLMIPTQSHFLMNPSGKLRFDYEAHLGGFVLIAPADEAKISLAEYTLELASKHKKAVQIERRYKEIDHHGQARISYWVRVIQASP
jgi:hypothetical protein